MADDFGATDVHEIGRGGSATVYAATDPVHGPVAVKVIRVSGRDATRRLEREARALQRLSGEHGIASIHRTGVTDRGEPYLVMPLYGDSLQQRIDVSGPMPWNEAAGYLVTVARAVHAAHQNGVTHADLKPANILLDAESRPVVTDFGIARTLDSSVSMSTNMAMTPAFAAPEMFDGAQHSAKTDVYSLGASLVALISGKAPFAGDGNTTPLALMKRIESDPVPDLAKVGAPQAIAAVASRAMSKDPDRRFQTAHEFAEALQVARTHNPAGETISRPWQQHEPIKPIIDPLAMERGSNRILIGAAATACVIALIVGLALLVSRGNGADDVLGATQGVSTDDRTDDDELVVPTPTATAVAAAPVAQEESTAARPIVVGALTIDNGTELLIELERWHQRFAADRNIPLDPDAGCWFGQTRSAGARTVVLCGPVGGSAARGDLFDEVPIALESRGTSHIAQSALSATDLNVPLREDLLLVGLDGSPAFRSAPTAVPVPTATPRPQPTARPTPTPRPRPTATPVPRVRGFCSADIGPNISINQKFTLTARFEPSNANAEYVFFHGDGSGPITNSSGYYVTPGGFRATMEWATSDDSGRAACENFVVSGFPSGWGPCAAANEPDRNRAYIINDGVDDEGLNVRLGPGTSFAPNAIEPLQRGTQARFIGCLQRTSGNDYWWAYEYGGYVSGKFANDR